MIEKLILKTLFLSALLITANPAFSELTRDQITDKSQPVWRDFTINLVHQVTIDIPFGGLNRLLCLFNKTEYRKWANLQSDADTPAYAYLTNIDERACGLNMRDEPAVVRATQLNPDALVRVEYWNATNAGALTSLTQDIHVIEEATAANPVGIMTIDQQLYNQNDQKMLLRQHSESSRVDDSTIQYQSSLYLDQFVINQSTPQGQSEEYYATNLYFEEGDAGYGTIVNKVFNPVPTGSELYPAGIPYIAGATNIAFSADYIRYERYLDLYIAGNFVQSKLLIESACVSRSVSWSYVPNFGYGVYTADGDRNAETFSAEFTNANNDVVQVQVAGFSVNPPVACRSLLDGSVVAAEPCSGQAAATTVPAFDVPDLTTVVGASGPEYIVRVLKPRKVYSQVDTSFCDGLVVRDTLPTPSHLFFEGNNIITAVPAAGAVLVNDFASDPDLDPFYAGKVYSPIEDSDADGVQNYADMFPEDGTKSADLDYDGVPDESDVSDDRVKFDNLNFEYPDAIEYITPSMYQGE